MTSSTPERDARPGAREALRQLRLAGEEITPEGFCRAWRGLEGAPAVGCAGTPCEGRCGACGHLASMVREAAGCIAGTSGEDSWVREEIARILGRLTPPWSASHLAALETALREALAAEVALRAELSDARAGIKGMLALLVSRLGEASDSTAAFGTRLGGYVERIERAQDAGALVEVAGALVDDTRQAQAHLAHAHTDLEAAHARVKAQDCRVVELESELARAHEQARTDALTGALNRRGFEEAWSREQSRATRSGAALALVVLDLDDFKRLNDAHGHPVGDRALSHLVHLARREMRPADAIARLGGEEFALILPATGAEAGAAVASRLLRALTREVFLGRESHLFLTFSAGVAAWREGEGWAEPLGRADEALYEAKRRGKNRVIVAGSPAFALAS